MGLFYAYLKDVDSIWDNRYLITFADREVADEWWRTISTAPSPYAGNVKRIFPQFYTHSTSVIHLPYTFFSRDDLPHAPHAKEFIDKLFFTYVCGGGNDLATAVPSIEVTDHISGRWYFVRSKADPWSHWYFRTDGECLVCGDAHCDAVHVSSECRTKFCVRIRDPGNGDQQTPKDLVMVGNDEISIIGADDCSLHVNDAGNLKGTRGNQGGTDLIFGDLKDRFITRAKKQVNGEIWEYVVPVERGRGEVWELVI